MMYSFEGKANRRPEQNLSGVSRKETRDLLLKRAHEERKKREEQRQKLKSTIQIQSWIRSFLVRQRVKKEQRSFFDDTEPFCDNITSLKSLLRKLLFFFNPQEDSERLLKVCERLLEHQANVIHLLDYDVSVNCLIRGMLVLCLKELVRKESTDVCIKCISAFTEHSDSREKIDVWPFLIRKGYFKQLRKLLDSKLHLECCLNLINRPLSILNLISSPTNVEIILSEFCEHFLCPTVSDSIKNDLIPFLKNTNKFPFDELLRFLNDSHIIERTTNLLYCVLALEPSYYEPTIDSLQVYSFLTIDLHNVINETQTIEDDSDVEEMEVSDDSLTMREYILLLNNQERVKKILNYFYQNSENEQILEALTQLCHNLLLVYQDSIHKYMLVFLLALRGTFLHKLWCSIKAHKRDEALAQQYSTSFGAWTHSHTSIAVFCCMFTLYKATLTDTDATNSNNGIFTNDDLCSIAEVLRTISLNLIDVAFPMCRSSMIHVTSEILHLYKSCFEALRIVYTLDLRRHFCKPGFWTKKKIHISQDLSKRNYLSKTLRPFHGIVSEDEDEYLPPLLTIEQRSLAILQQLPFLVEFNARVLLLRDLCRSSITGSSNGLSFNHRDFTADSAVIIRRTHLYEDSFEKLSPENEPDMRQKIRIQFVNNAGLDEPGIDGGGIFKEFINEVLKTAFDPNRGFFLLTNDNLLYPNPNVHLLFEDYTRHYFFIGRLVGKALFENILVDLPLAEFFLEKLLVERIDAHHLQSLDPVLYRNLLYLRDYSGDVQDLGLDFTTASNDLGETRVKDLKPNGRNIPVTNYNRLEYIHLLADYKLNKQIKKQCAAFREGLDSVVPLIWLKLFSYHELQIIIGGDTQEMDINDLKNHTAYGGEFTSDHPTIVIFWKIVESFTDVQKKQLLKFVTSCSRAPLLGFKELSPSFCIQSAGSEDRMPTASTCLNLLKLPIISQETILRDKLLQAIEQQAGFELS